MEVIQQVTLSGVSTKQDVQDLRKEMQDMRIEVQDVRTEIQNAKNEMLKFQVVQTITIVGMMVGLFQIFL